MKRMTTWQVLVAIILALVLIVGMIFISTVIVNFISTAVTLLDGGQVTAENDLVNFFMEKTGKEKLLLVLGSTVVGVIIFATVIATVVLAVKAWTTRKA